MIMKVIIWNLFLCMHGGGVGGGVAWEEYNAGYSWLIRMDSIHNNSAFKI